jgi:hypothetical protein
MEHEFMLTTLDNPYNPFTEFDEWDTFDKQKGYHTCAYLARITSSSDDLSEADQALAIDKAMNEIVDLNLSGNYIKVREDYKPITIEPEGS